MKSLRWKLPYDLAVEFFRCFADPFTYHPVRNIYNLFGFLWGLPIPIVTLWIGVHFQQLPVTLDSARSVMAQDGFYYLFLLHPFLFYMVFGSLGTMNMRRDNLIMDDTLKLARTRERLLLDEKMATLGRLAAGVAHEINNPLSVIIAKLGYLDSLPFGSQAFLDQLKGDMVKMEKHLLRVADITSGLLSFARQSGEMRVTVQFQKVIEETLTFIQHELRKHNLTLETSFGAQTAVFRGSPGELQQVFLNLFGNAIDAMKSKEEGTLTVTFQQLAGQFEVRIADTGNGIPEAVRPHIFEPFFTTKELGQGTGLGLSISFGIIAKHRGTLRFESVEGRGTTFVITLPFAKETV